MKKIGILLLIFFQLTITVYADDYPKNPNIDIQHYSFEFTLSDTTNTIWGKTTVTALFKKDNVDQIRLELVKKTNSLNGKGMVVESITKGERKLSYTHKNDALFIDFSEPAVAGSKIQFTINYHGKPADGLQIGPTKYGNRSFFSNNFPNRAKHWLPVVNHPYEKATCEFKITSPSHYQVVSNGVLVEETNLEGTKKFTHWKQSVPISSWLYVLGVAEFAVKYVGEFKGKSIQTWVYPQNRKAGFDDFAEPTKHTLSFFSEYVGPFAYEKLANIQSTSVGGGMEAASAVFYSEDSITGKDTPYINMVIIHEIAHHWFGNSVTESTWDDVWLSEGFATYFTMLFREHANGREYFVDELQKAKERVFNFYKKNPGYKIIDERSPETDNVTSDATYQKGAWILHMLRNLIGDHDFKKGIQSYYNRYMNSTATTSDYRFEMEQASGKNLKSFFEQWLYQGGNPELRGTWRYDKKKKSVIVNLRQVQNQKYQFKVPLEIGVYKGDQVLPEVKIFRLNQRQEEFTISVDEQPKKVVLDPNTKLLAKWEFSKQQ
jgi:aminopeptidase N